MTCDLCDKTRKVNKQMKGNKCLLKICDGCEAAVIEQAEKFAKEEELKLEVRV